MIKDLLQSMNDIYSDSNLSLKEKSILIYLIKQFNVKDNYAYPKYEDIMSETGIGRRANVADAIKSLVVKGYITVKKTIGNKSHYFIEKYLHFVGEKAQEVDFDKKENLNDESNVEIPVEEVETKENNIKSLIVSDCKESGIQMTIDDIEEVKFTNSVNGSKIAKVFEGSKTFKITKWFLDRIARIDETIVDMVLEEKPKTAKLFLIKCIEKSLMAGLELAGIIKNTLEFYAKKDEDYAGAMTTQYDSSFYMFYTNKQIGLI